METPIITMQQSKGVALYQVIQGAQMKAATYREELCQKLYLALGISKGQSAPIQVKTIKTHEEPYVIRKNLSMDTSYKKVPPERNLMQSCICFHCQKKGHYAQNCHTRCQAAKIESTQSTAPVIPVTLANCFSVLEEETCLSTTIVVPVLAPKLLDAREIKKCTFHANKIREITSVSKSSPVWSGFWTQFRVNRDRDRSRPMPKRSETGPDPKRLVFSGPALVYGQVLLVLTSHLTKVQL